jgi:hypothetical protein
MGSTENTSLPVPSVYNTIEEPEMLDGSEKFRKNPPDDASPLPHGSAVGEGAILF